MKIKAVGFVLMIFGFIGGFSMLASITGWEALNTLSKDQVISITGFTWLILGKE